MENIGTLPGAVRTSAAAARGGRPRGRRALRSVGAVLAGMAATFVVSSAVDALLHATGVFPPCGQQMGSGLFALALSYRIPFNIGGAWLAARLAADRPLGHALALGAIG